VSLYGKVDILLNNSGINNYGSFDKYTAEQFQQVMDVNAYGVFYGMKTVVPLMNINKAGSIINVSSTELLNGYPLIPGYVRSNLT
jgi:3alpha(or 20beta)-hydroxysteroid dehydrogenase